MTIIDPFFSFQIPNITEMYGSTEGTVGLINSANQIGAVGHLPRSFLFSMLPQILPITIIKLDENGN